MISDEIADARSAGLRYVEDSIPGFSRKRKRNGFDFFDTSGTRITDESEVARIRSLAIPPAYEHVWICPFPNGHVQATARDARGRKQYRYHKRWREVRDANKYESTRAFAKALPAVRARLKTDLAGDALTREKVLATVVKLLEETLIRVGNEGYAKDNGSFGLTTLRPRHVKIEGDKRIRLKFRGKSGVEHAVTIDDRRLAKTVKRCRDLPGQTLFSYLDDAGDAHAIDSDDVNAYLRETTGEDFSAKDYRTWAATVECALQLERIGAAPTVAQAKKNVTTACTATAALLGNTPAVARRAYIHPVVVETYLDDLAITLPHPRANAATRGLEPPERRVLAFLERAQRADASKKRVAQLHRSVRDAKQRKKKSARSKAS